MHARILFYDTCNETGFHLHFHYTSSNNIFSKIAAIKYQNLPFRKIALISLYLTLFNFI